MRRVYQYTRTLRVPFSAEGLIRIDLGLEDLAILCDRFADVRVVDKSGRQWPYLIDRRSRSRDAELCVETPVREDRASRFELGVPFGGVRCDRLTLTIRDPHFDHAFRLLGHGTRGDVASLVEGRLTRSGDDRILVDFGPRRIRAFTLIVIDGENEPLGVRAATVRAPLPVLFLAAPPGEYVLTLGDSDARAPCYDIRATGRRPKAAEPTPRSL
jgi:hypothetical protein